MTVNHIATASTVILSDAERVWEALIDPKQIKEYFFGSTVESDFQEGSPITWKGEWEGKPYEDKGVILKVQPRKLLSMSHFSPLSGKPDVPENYHTVTFILANEDGHMRITIEQDKNANDEEKKRNENSWNTMLDSLKTFIEKENK